VCGCARLLHPHVHSQRLQAMFVFRRANQDHEQMKRSAAYAAVAKQAAVIFGFLAIVRAAYVGWQGGGLGLGLGSGWWHAPVGLGWFAIQGQPAKWRLRLGGVSVPRVCLRHGPLLHSRAASQFAT
jgi:hypothetical protein